MRDLVELALPQLQAVAPTAQEAALQRRVHAWLTHLRRRPERQITLAGERRPLELAAALWAAWHAGREVFLAPPGQSGPGYVQPTEDPVDCDPRPPALARLDPASTWLHLRSSGSTGPPRWVRIGLAQLQAEVYALEATFGPQLGDAPCCSTVPLHHLYGLLFALLWPLAAGRTVPAACLQPTAALPTLPTPPILVTSPAHLRRLGRPGAPPVRIVFSSGGPLPAAIAQRAAAHLGGGLREIYGSTETGGIAWRVAGATAWTPLPSVRWRLIDGRLEVQSAFLPAARPRLTADCARCVPEAPGVWAAAGREGSPWRTDAFLLDGRCDRLVKVEEEQVALADLEAHVTGLPWVEACSALLLPVEPPVLAAVVALEADAWRRCQAEGEAACRAQLRRHVASLSPAARPRRWRLVPHLPSDDRGKTPHAALLAQFA